MKSVNWNLLNSVLILRISALSLFHSIPEQNMATLNWKIIRLLGEGDDSNTFLVQKTSNSEKYALKMFLKNSQDYSEELAIHSRLKHQSIIELKEIITPNDFCLSHFRDEEDLTDCKFTGGYAMKYAAQGTLLDLTTKLRSLPEIIARSYAVHLIDALEYLHNQVIAHCDLQLSNLLLDENFCLKLTGFRAAKVLSAGVLTTTDTETLMCSAPEAILEKEYDAFSADIFSLGVIIFELCCGHSPFERASLEDETYRLIVEKNWEEFWALNEEICSYNQVFLSPHIKELLQNLLCPDPKLRPSVNEIKNFAWMKKPSLDRLKVESWIVEIAKKRKISSLLSEASSS